MAYSAPAATTVGHVHLKVADIERAIGFYSGVLGFDVMARYGRQAAFLSAGGYHHHIGLNTWESQGGTAPPPGHTGLYHAAFLYPDRPSLAEAIKRVKAAGIPFTGAAHHGVSTAVYLDDPDGNGVELYYDWPREDWQMTPEGELAIVNERFDIDEFVAETEQGLDT